MNIRHHHGWGHGLRPGTTADMNCGACQREDALIASLRDLPPGEEPSNAGPLCAEWYADQPGPDGCGHLTCYLIAYQDAPPHTCGYETFAEDPITIAYGLGSSGLASCQVCDLWQQLSERRLAERAWEAATERGNR